MAAPFIGPSFDLGIDNEDLSHLIVEDSLDKDGDLDQVQDGIFEGEVISPHDVEAMENKTESSNGVVGGAGKNKGVIHHDAEVTEGGASKNITFIHHDAEVTEGGASKNMTFVHHDAEVTEGGNDAEVKEGGAAKKKGVIHHDSEVTEEKPVSFNDVEGGAGKLKHLFDLNKVPPEAASMVNVCAHDKEVINSSGVKNLSQKIVRPERELLDLNRPVFDLNKLPDDTMDFEHESEELKRNESEELKKGINDMLKIYLGVYYR